MRREPTSALPKWSIFNAIFLLALGLAEAFVGERTSPTALLLYLPQHPFGLLTLVLIAVSLKLRNFRQFGFNLVVGLAFTIFLLGLQVPLRTSPPQGKTLRIMTWNIEKLKGTPEAWQRSSRRKTPISSVCRKRCAGIKATALPNCYASFRLAVPARP